HGLPAASRPGDQHEPAWQLGEPGHRGRQRELLELWRLVRDHAEGAADRALLQVEVAAEAAHALHAEGEVELAVLLELLLLRLGEEAVAELLRVVPAERRVREGHELAVEPDDRRAVGGEVEVRPPALDHLAQERFPLWPGALDEQAPCHPALPPRRVRGIRAASALCHFNLRSKRLGTDPYISIPAPYAAPEAQRGFAEPDAGVTGGHRVTYVQRFKTVGGTAPAAG